MDKKKIYLGNGKKKSESWLKGSLCIDDILANIDNATTSKNGKRYMSINISLYDKPNKYGNDVSITLDTWKPENKPQIVRDTSGDFQGFDVPMEIDLEEIPF